MAVLLTQTRKQIRQSVGHNVGGVYVSAASATGTTSTLIDNTLSNSNDYIAGRWTVLTSGTNSGAIRIVDHYDGPASQMNFRGAVLSLATASADTYELWDEDLPPARIHDFINRAIRAVPRKAAPPSTIYNFHTGGDVRNFSVPTALVGIQDVFYRSSFVSEVILPCDAAFDESVTASVTASLDQEDYRSGGGSSKFVIGAGVGTGLIASDSISSLDLSGYTHCEFWIKSSVATSAADLTVRLSSTASAGTGTDDISVPALVANTWTYCRVALGNPDLDTAIISVGLRQAVDIGAARVRLDDIRAVRAEAEEWSEIHRAYWYIDQDERELVIKDSALGNIGYTLLKVVGVKKPTELTAETTVCDVEPEYIIAKTTALLMRSHADREAKQREAAHIEADRWEAIAERALGKVQTPQGVRWVSDA